LDARQTRTVDAISLLAMKNADSLDVETLQALAQRAWPGLGVSWFEEIGSTHLEAKAWLERGQTPPPFLMIANHQTAGRGRRGNAWIAPAGTSLLMTLALLWNPEAARDQLPPALLSALAAAEALDAFLPAPASIKWPNDLQARGQKIGGVLAELARFGQSPALILSAGLNVLQPPEQLPPPGEGIAATSIRLERDAARLAPLPPDNARATLLERFLEALRREIERPSEDALDRLRARCSTLGRRVRVEREGSAGPLLGVAESLGADGSLWIRREDERLERCLSGHLREMEERQKSEVRNQK
jgi:BirA family biotin operon repressor/biotin-[acetyl-CoA-carboxylase] ligase